MALRQLSCRKHTPHNVCQQMLNENKYKYLCDATFLNARAAHAVHKEFLVSVNFSWFAYKTSHNGRCTKLDFIVSFLATNLSMTSVFQNVKMSKFHSADKETLGQKDFRSLSTFHDLLTKSPTEGVAQKWILYSFSCNQFMSSVILECKNVKIPCNPSNM